ncbi:MAG TPA: DUF805 domain-containing protein [Caulobacteraceae bacterium]|jgi:uncharacterized membrane protein YhaH (DUF805 family)|nr:DUF805 domain-containing protein [Caulobacteraceae bacterium]
MGGLSEFFSFEGRIGRASYLSRTLCLWLGIGAAAFGGRMVLETLVRPLGLGGYDAGTHGLAAGVLLAALWSSAALASRRLRDMGLEPVHWLPAYFALWAVYTALLQPFGRLQPDRFSFITLGWAALQSLPTLALLLWPARAARPQAAMAYEPAQPTAYMNWREPG